MDQTNGGRRLVDVLAARAGGAVDLHFNVLGPDLDILGIVGDLGDDLDRGERRLPPRVGVERRHAHQPVDAILALEQAVGIRALDQDAGRFDAGLVAVEIVEDLIAESMGLDPVRVHPIEHRGPVLRLGAARACLEGDDGVVAVIFAGEQRLQPFPLHLFLKRLVALDQLVQHRVVIFLDRHLADRHQIVPMGTHLLITLDLGLQLTGLPRDLLRGVGIVPKAVRFDLRVQPVKVDLALLDVQRRGQFLQFRMNIIELYLVFIKFDHT